MLFELESEDYKLGVIRENARVLSDIGENYQDLLQLIGEASIVLLGEATHGTHEFYRERAQITKLLIQTKGFNAICAEASWPESHRVNRFVRGQGEDREAVDALRDFTQFPSWMWANADILDFIGWLRNHNESRKDGFSEVGFYGLDLYSLHKSASEVVSYLESFESQFLDALLLERTKERYSCLKQLGEDTQSYAFSTALGLVNSCESAVNSQLQDFVRSTDVYRETIAGAEGQEAYFNAIQNCRIVCAAEHYYRTLLRSDVSSWNLRDRHMAETLEHVRQHYLNQGMIPKIVVWAHNSHIGQANACEMAQRGEVNIGQLVKERYGSNAVAIGFTTHSGTVTAAANWSEHSQKSRIIPAIPGSYEDLFHKVNFDRFFLGFRGAYELTRVLQPELLQRAIGVIYRPETERLSHYYYGSLPAQYDGVIHFDHTRAVEPLEHKSFWLEGNETPETYPTGI